MIDFAVHPPALSKRERLLVLVTTGVVAATRLAALARGPWDWDEMLFLLGLRDYDVALHHPHPPGFPLFMLLARLLVEAGFEPFRALQLINLVAAILLVPAMLMLCRELRLSFDTSLAAAVLFSFLPNVWFFGGSGFSDVASIVLAIVACALLLRGARSPHALIAGAVVLAIAAGFRPQNLLVGLLPALIGSWCQLRRRRVAAVVIAASAGAAILVLSYAGAVAATGEWHRYRDSVVAHQRYLTDVDSFLSTSRPSLLQVSDDFFVRPFRFAPVNTALVILAVVSIFTAVVRFRIPVLLAIGSFGPFWILAWLTLDFHSAGRFSIGYMPLLAILASDGLAMIAMPARARRAILAGGVILIAGLLATWTWPAVSQARREVSPPVAAVSFIREALPAGATIYVQKRLRPFAEYYLGDRPLVHLEEELPPAVDSQTASFYLREGVSRTPGAKNFLWPQGNLWNIVRRRYFAVSVVPLSGS